MAISIATPLIALLAGGAQGYGNTIARTRAQQAADAAETQRQLTSLAADAVGRKQQQDFEAQQQANAFQNDANIENLRNANALAGKKADVLTSLLADPYSNFKGQPYSYDAGVLQNAGATPQQIQTAIGAEPSTTATTAIPSAFTAGAQTSPLLPTKPTQGIASLLRGAVGAIAAPTGAANIYGNPLTAGGAPGASLRPPANGPLSRTVTTPNPQGVAIPYNAADQATIDYNTNRANNPNVQANKETLGSFGTLMSTIPSDKRGAALQAFNTAMGTDFTSDFANTIPYIDKAGNIQSQISDRDQRTGAYVQTQQARIPLIQMQAKSAAARIPLISAQITHMNALINKINNSPTPMDPQTRALLSSYQQRADQAQAVINAADTRKTAAMGNSSMNNTAKQAIIRAENDRITKAGVLLKSLNVQIQKIDSGLAAQTQANLPTASEVRPLSITPEQAKKMTTGQLLQSLGALGGAQ